jgi:hypothetical protein
MRPNGRCKHRRIVWGEVRGESDIGVDGRRRLGENGGSSMLGEAK